MRLWRKAARDLVKMALHRSRVGARHDDRHPGIALGADRAEQISRLGAQIGGRLRSGAALRPAAGARVFLAEAHLVLKPDFYGRFRGKLCRDRADTLGKGFLNSSI